MFTAFVTWLVVLDPIVRVAGGVGCPTAAEVDTRLRTLLPAASAADGPDVATLEESRSRLRVTVRRPDGTTLGVRELDRAHSCADLAAAVALVIATWESDVHPEFALALPAPATPTSAPPAADPPPAHPPVIEQRPPRTEAAARPPGEPRAARPAATRAAFDIGAGLVAAVAPHTLDGSFESELVAAASIVAGWIHHGSGPGARLALGAAAPRAMALGPGEARWQRATAAFGPQFRFWRPASTAMLDLHGELIGAALNVRGQRFSTNGNDWSFDVGAGAGARLWLGTGAWRPWVDLSLAIWPIEHVVYATPSQEAVSLPRFETFLALGVAFFRS